MKKALLALLGALMIGAFAASHAQKPAPAPNAARQRITSRSESSSGSLGGLATTSTRSPAR